MQIADIGPEARAKFSHWVLDTLIEKHERYIQWYRLLERVSSEHGPITLTISGYPVLYPFSIEHTEVVRCYPSEEGELLTIFLKEGDPDLTGAALIVCRRVPGEEFYVVIIWHDLYLETLRYLD